MTFFNGPWAQKSHWAKINKELSSIGIINLISLAQANLAVLTAHSIESMKASCGGLRSIRSWKFDIRSSSGWILVILEPLRPQVSFILT